MSDGRNETLGELKDVGRVYAHMRIGEASGHSRYSLRSPYLHYSLRTEDASLPLFHGAKTRREEKPRARARTDSKR